MTHVPENRIASLFKAASSPTADIRKGIEREGLRVDQDAAIAQTPHSLALGSALTHPRITTDYSEALLELITPVARSTDELMGSLSDIHRFTQSQLGDELLWAGSMPARLNGETSVPIAVYGASNSGQLKHIYRQGLGVRYGRIMQSIAGLHYNFSLTPEFMCRWINALGQSCTDHEQISEQYFALIRNFRRRSWLLMYLFGASPVLDETFLNGRPSDLLAFGKRSRGLPFATSLRMGDLGYHNKAQSGLDICFNRLSTYLKTLYTATHTPWPAYQAIGIERDGQYLQLNANILQIENEYYSPVRPKRTAFSGERPLHALNERGVEYLEVRCLDLNPFLPMGIDAMQVDFLDLFLLHGLVDDSPLLSEQECRLADENFRRVVRAGRDPQLTLAHQGDERPLREVGARIMGALADFAHQLDTSAGHHRYQDALAREQCKLDDVALTPSAQVLAAMQAGGMDHLELMLSLARQHQQTMCATPLPDEVRTGFAQQVTESLVAEAGLRASDTLPFPEFLAQYMK